MQSNAFNLITQVSSIMAIFKQEDWKEASSEEKSYAFQQLGRTLGQIAVDLTGFKPTIEVVH
jgi:hypothetical protein